MAGFGYGKKTDLDVGKDPHNIAPSPDTYDLASFVKTNQDHHVGFTPLFSREVLASYKVGNRSDELHRSIKSKNARRGNIQLIPLQLEPQVVDAAKNQSG